MDRLGVHIYELSVQDGLVALRFKVNSDFPTKQDEGYLANSFSIHKLR